MLAICLVGLSRGPWSLGDVQIENDWWRLSFKFWNGLRIFLRIFFAFHVHVLDSLTSSSRWKPTLLDYILYLYRRRFSSRSCNLAFAKGRRRGSQFNLSFNLQRRDLPIALETTASAFWALHCFSVWSRKSEIFPGISYVSKNYHCDLIFDLRFDKITEVQKNTRGRYMYRAWVFFWTSVYKTKENMDIIFFPSVAREWLLCGSSMHSPFLWSNIWYLKWVHTTWTWKSKASTLRVTLKVPL